MYMVLYNESREVHKRRRERGVGLCLIIVCLPMSSEIWHEGYVSLILRRSRTGTVWFCTSTSNKRAARPKLYTESLTRDLKRMYSRFTLVRISVNL